MLAIYLLTPCHILANPSPTTAQVWCKQADYLDAMIASQTDSSKVHALLKQAMTDEIDDREIFMKGIDYSYYYEQEDEA